MLVLKLSTSPWSLLMMEIHEIPAFVSIFVTFFWMFIYSQKLLKGQPENLFIFPKTIYVIEQ